MRESEVSPRRLVQPLFVAEDGAAGDAVGGLPGLRRFALGDLANEARALDALGVPAVLLFGVPATTDAEGSSAYADDGIVQRAVREIKAAAPELLIWTDVCLCAYTDHGHCGVLRADGVVDNDETLPLLAHVALSHACAGADAVAPSDMMDGRVQALRAVLDGDGFAETPIISYAAKYSSALYGPFRDAAGSAPATGDRRGYQLDPGNRREALREARADLDEGADIVIVKPALPYLDVIAALRQQTLAPIAAYQVSGEYAMIKAAAAQGALDERPAALEALGSIARAGADLTVTYYAKEVAQWLA